jgi:hypothetical protein
LISGRGLTVIVKVIAVPVHEFAEGVTVMVAVNGLLPVFVAVKAGILPVPLAAKPIEVFELVHEYVVPLTVPLKLMALTLPL